MRVLCCANHFNTGGITSYLMTLAKGLLKRGHRVVLVSSGGNVVPEAEALGVKVMLTPFKMKSELHPLLFLDVPRLARIVREEKIDIIHAHTRASAMSAMIAGALTGVPYVTTCHGFFKPHVGRKILPLWGKAVIAISAPIAKHLATDMGVDKKQIFLVPNGIDPERFVPADDITRANIRREFGLGKEPSLGIIARLSDVKGHGWLLQAMPDILKTFPDTRLFILGEGPMEALLKKDVSRLGIEKSVVFRSTVQKTADVLPAFDVFVMPSLSEGLGLSVMEAQAMGIPVVATKVGGLIDAVKDGETGILVPAKDPEALAKAVVRLLADRALAKRMGEAGRIFMMNNFSADTMTEGTLGMYQKVLAFNSK
ncbi:MAG: glycosyltransferase family 4 protein [Candidatus Omnitrophica bacterium]|nr:glycosyltransferase family 4 protein [Candidatus Omnitrophota bacterium]